MMGEGGTAYAELALTSNFSFLRGGSHPDELVLMAGAMGLEAVGIADRNTLAGVVRAHVAAREAGIKLLVGTRLVTREGFEVLCYPRDRAAYGRLARLLTLGNRRAPKGECFLSIEDIFAHAEGQMFIAMPPAQPAKSFEMALRIFARRTGGQCSLALIPFYDGQDAYRFAYVSGLAEATGVPCVATNDVHYHVPERRVLQDVVTCIREHCTIDDAGYRLLPNAERHLKDGEEMARLFAAYPDAVARSVEIAEACTFSLDELRYEYPDENIGGAGTVQEQLTRLTWEGARSRFGDALNPKLVADLEHELALIGELGYAPYFLTVYDIVRFARGKGILCQGRGSAANSAVCYCLGITSVDPTRIDLLFERFVSAERNEPPDIDVDFEHERREEVIQYIYEKYGRARAGIAATVITYRARSAIREVGKALGLSLDAVGALAGTVWGWSSRSLDPDHVREAGLDPDEPRLHMALDLAHELIGFPRHLSQHVGGFVITKGPLSEVIPIANAAMADRTYVEWDKDDLDALGILKIDVLALGMLSCIRKAFEFLEIHYDRPMGLADVPAEDPRVYDMLCLADSIGVFQVESRAQMSMLPRLRPRDFYDLVIEVAIVRPGPIQGDMVHPYLRRRDGIEAVEYPSEELRHVLGKTMGVPLFQEQAMKIAIVGAGFTPSEADALRRAMATFRRSGSIHAFREKFLDGMLARGYEADFAERCFSQIEGFADYGFPESHAASFALLVYVSAWLKCHYPDVFCAAILNSLPMGFYAPAQLVRDARDHGVAVRPVDVNFSDWDCTLEPLEMGVGERGGERTEEGGKACAVRLGFRQIKGFAKDHAEQLVLTRKNGFDSVRDLWLRTGLSPKVLERLAGADAFRSIGHDRRAALWAVRGIGGAGKADPVRLPLFAAAEQNGLQHEAEVALPAMPLGEHVVHDYASLRLSLKAHPMAFLREAFAAKGVVANARLMEMKNDTRVQVAGLVLVRQRPGSAKGVIFATLEDETGVANIIVWPKTYERYRKTVLGARLLLASGKLQREGIVIHLVADRLVDCTEELARLTDDGLELPNTLSYADHVKTQSEDRRDVTARRETQRHARANRILPRSRDFH